MMASFARFYGYTPAQFRDLTVEEYDTLASYLEWEAQQGKG